MATDAMTCDEHKREVLQTMQGMVNEIESKRLLLEAILDERPELAEEINRKLSLLQANLDALFQSLDWMEETDCANCRCRQLA